MKNLYTKLQNIQKEVKAIAKEEINPHFKNKYFNINGLLAELKPILNANNIIVMQPIASLDGKPVLNTWIIDSESGEELRTYLLLPENNNPQQMGSAVTYYRRYALQSLFLLEAEDDDGNTASVESPDKSFAPRPVSQTSIKKMVQSNNPF